MTAEELAPLLRTSERGITLPCRVQPRASKSAVGEKFGDAVKIYLTSPPVDGKANEELCKFLAKKTGLSRSCVTLLNGETSRSKTVLFTGASLTDIINGLCEK